MNIPIMMAMSSASATATIRKRQLNEDIPYFPKTEYANQREYEEFKRLNCIKEKDCKKRRKIKSKKLKNK